VPMGKQSTLFNHRLQRDRYVLSEPAGCNFHPQFEPELTRKGMLRLGIFGGKYLTECRDGFPSDWFAEAKLSSKSYDASRSFFGVKASQRLSVWRERDGFIPTTRAVVSMVLPLLHGSQVAGRDLRDWPLARHERHVGQIRRNCERAISAAEDATPGLLIGHMTVERCDFVCSLVCDQRQNEKERHWWIIPCRHRGDRGRLLG